MKLCGFLFALLWKYLFPFSLTFFKITTQFGSQWSVSYWNEFVLQLGLFSHVYLSIYTTVYLSIK